MVIDWFQAFPLVFLGLCPGMFLCWALVQINGMQFLGDAIISGFIFWAVLFFVLFMGIAVGPYIGWVVLYFIILVFVGGWVSVDFWNNETELEHQRILAAKRREQEQILADRGVFNADQGLTKQQKLRSVHEERWYAAADAARAAEAIRAAEYRAAETPEPIIDVPPQSANSPLSALEEQCDELQEKLQEATADGQHDEVARLSQDIAAIQRTIALMKKASG